MQGVIDTLLGEQLLPFWVLLLVVLVERYLPWPEKYHPISFVKMLTIGIQSKVLSPEKQATRQQKISGALACVVILLPFCTVLAVFKYLSEYPIFFEAFMLLIALHFQHIQKQTRRISIALKKQQKILARHTLSNIVLRETENMSPMGIVKANIESLLLRYSFQYCSVIFWYLLTGGAGALVYRLLYEMSQSWNHKLVRFRYFGQPVRHLTNLMQWIPGKLASLGIMIAVNISQGSKALFQRTSYQSNHGFILNTCGASLSIKLGGPAYYNGRKIRSANYGGNRQVILEDNERALTAINRATWVWMTFYFMGCALAFLIAAK